MMIERGLSPVEAGLTASLMQVVGLTGTFVAPFIAVRYQQQSTFNMSIGILYIVGFASLFIPILWLNILSIGLVGLGMGASISLAYTLITLRTKGDNYTAALSGMAQSAGYFLAAFGPMLFGMAFDIWHNWDMLIYLMVLASCMFTYFGYFAGKDKTI
jgi:CP family cyanate transporter-like MFS transporter